MINIGDKVFAIDPETEDLAHITFFGDDEVIPVVGDIVGINMETVFIKLIADDYERVVTQPKETIVRMEDEEVDYRLYFDYDEDDAL